MGMIALAARTALVALLWGARGVMADPVDIGAAIRNSERDYRELVRCPDGAPMSYDLRRRVLTCATSAGVVSQCVPVPPIAPGSLSVTPIPVTWPTPFPPGGFRLIHCQVDSDSTVGVAEWRAIPPTVGTAVDVEVFNRNALASQGGRLCCYAQSQLTPTPTGTPAVTVSPTASPTPI